MNPVEGGIRRLDCWQQRRAVVAFPFAVVKKFGDDQAGNLVALLSYHAFLSVFPLLLALTGVLGIVLRGHPGLQARIEKSALADFPIIGSQLHAQLGVATLNHSGIALVVGLVGAVLGGRGLANSVQYTLNTLWGVPKVDRPGFPWNLLRTLGLLALMAVGAVLTAASGSIVATTHTLGVSGVLLRVVAWVLGVVLDSGLFLVAFRLATARRVRTADLVPAAVLSGVAWQVLLSFAGVIVSHDLRHAQAVAGLFGVVLGLFAWLGLQATITVYAIEADVVRVRHLWPRSITQPPLTPGDRRTLTESAVTETRRPEQRVEVTFTPAADADPLTGRR